MGTRSLTEVKSNRHVLCTMYRQMDGYPTGHGAELLKRFGRTKLVNGLGRDDSDIANGMGCLAAQIVAHFKNKPGGVYLEPSGCRNVGEEFIYVISDRNGTIHLDLYEGEVTYFGAGPLDNAPEESMPLYSGPLADFVPEQAKGKFHST